MLHDVIYYDTSVVICSLIYVYKIDKIVHPDGCIL